MFCEDVHKKGNMFMLGFDMDIPFCILDACRGLKSNGRKHGTNTITSQGVESVLS
jgi:hypothetical protein